MLAIVVLQYGKWRETVACLESLARSLPGTGARVILVDNASPDDSVARVDQWIGGGLAESVPRPIHDTLAHLWWPLSGIVGAWQDASGRSAPESWTLLRLNTNAGFAAGMNAGIRHALTDDRVTAVWLLNNDTVVSPDAIAAVIHRCASARSTIAQFGTRVMYYDRPGIVQTLGWCQWNPWLATTHRVGDGADGREPIEFVPKGPGYVYGASWVIRAPALRDVGLLSEASLLYGEELDWSCRAAPHWGAGLIETATVWHREGATIGAGASGRDSRSELADLSGISARLRLTRRFFPRYLPTVYFGLAGAVFNRFRCGDPQRAIAVARLVMRGGFDSPERGGLSRTSPPPDRS